MNDGAIARWIAYLFGASWKTSASGYLGCLMFAWPELEALFDGDPNTHVVWSRVIAAVAFGSLGLHSRGRYVSTEHEVAKKIGVELTDGIAMTPAAKLALIDAESQARSASRVGPNETGKK